MSIEIDARVKRTREALRQAMTDLAADSPLDAITVRAIVARAGVSYATFFRHYVDKDELLAEVSELLIRDFLAQVRPLMQQQDRAAAARSLCQYVLEHLTIHKALLAGGSSETVRTAVLRQAMAVMASSRPSRPASPFEDLMLFHVVSTIHNLESWWLRNLETVDADTMAEVMERLVLTPVGDLRARKPSGLTSKD